MWDRVSQDLVVGRSLKKGFDIINVPVKPPFVDRGCLTDASCVAILTVVEAPVGILESKNDRFMADVVSQLYGLHGIMAQFVSLGEERIPFEREYRVVVDRLSFRYPFLGEIMKNLALGGTYVINNPFAALAANKMLDIKLGSQIGINFPKTIVLPDRTAVTETEGLVAEPHLSRVGDDLGFPCIVKPFNGYAWEDVHVVGSIEELQNLYNVLAPRHILLAQQLIKFKDYYRVFCFDKKDVLFIKWIPKPFAMGQYLYSDPDSIGVDKQRLTALTIRFNQALDFDVNVIEWCVDDAGQWWVIDAFNEVPDVTKEALPPEYYSWIIDRLVACIKDKLDSGKKNRTSFG